MSEWIDWEKSPVPDDVRGIFIKYEDGFVDCDRYHYESKERKYRNSKPISWRFIERRNKEDKSIQCTNVKNNPFLRDIRECYVRKDDD